MAEIENKHVLGFGKDYDDEAQPIGIQGEEKNELVTLSLTEIEKFQQILKELKKFNIQLESITNVKLTRKDAISHKGRL